MRTSHPPLIVGNWKMNPTTVGHARKLFLNIREKLGHRKIFVVPVVAPPYPFISEVERINPSQRFELAAQDVYFEASGAHTGEVSLPMVKSVGVSYVIVGHSERRARGETDEEIYKDIQIIIKHKLTAIVCVGEKERDIAGNYFGVVEAQVRAAVRDLHGPELKRLVIAYEPIWAIGTGNTATAADAYEMKLFIQKVLTDIVGRTSAEKIRIIYGGSVNKKNAEELLKTGQVDGFLIGGASLKAAEFVTIISIAETYAQQVKSTK